MACVCCRYGALLQGCLATGQPVLLVGGSGVGKSAVVKVRSNLSMVSPQAHGIVYVHDCMPCIAANWLVRRSARGFPSSGSAGTQSHALPANCLPPMLYFVPVQERIDTLRAELGGNLESAVLNCCAFTRSAAAQQLLESNLVKRGHR